jgi:hypothetical protein
MADCELMTIITAVACGITKCFSTDDISILAASFTQLGDTLATYLVQVEIEEKRTAAREAEKSKGTGKSNNERKEPIEYRGQEP